MFTKSWQFEKQMQDAQSYAEWQKAAIAYDIAMGFDLWKQSDESKHYDYASIRKRLAELRKLRRKKDNEGLLYTLNEGIHGNMSGMGHGRLYSKARFGTKQVISDYIEEIASALEHLARKQVRSISEEEKL
ncbi:MAG: DUF3336 domain-containing protein, partial [Woeseia sp.]